MRTDAMGAFFGGKGKAATRMDCTGFQKRNSTGTGSVSMRDETVGKKPFQKALSEVTTENTAAHRSANARLAGKQSGTMRVVKENDRKEFQHPTRNEPDELSEEQMYRLLGILAEGDAVTPVDENGVMLLVADDVADDAESVVREVLATLSETLGISVFGNLDELSLKEVGQDTRKQFAEIVFTLRKMLQAFDFSREQGIPIDLPSGTVEGEGIDAVSDMLQVSVFKIEVACSMLGIAESVQKQVAIQMEVYQAGGIIQAIDPSTISMASQHTDRLFKGLFSGEQSTTDIAALVQQVKKLLAENGGDTASVTVETAGNQSSLKGDLQQFDATVYRAMLKIDKQEAVEKQNGEAVLETGKPGMPKIGQPVIPVAEDPAAMNPNGSSESGQPLALQSATPMNTVVGGTGQLPGTLMRMTDETVMEQITGKLQTVLRSGLTEVRIQLRPESLGEVSMRIRMEDDVVVAKIEVQNQQVKEIMERNLPMLKDALAQQNITAGSFDVQVNNGTGRHFGNMPNSPWNEEEMARQGLGGEGREKEHGTDGEHRHHPESETGRRFGSNSVEYFA